jgi:spore coat protein CotH
MIIGIAVVSLFLIDASTEEALFINLPTDFDIMSVLAQERAQEEELMKLRDDYLSSQNELISYYDQLLTQQQSSILIEEQRVEEQRIKDIENAIKYAYTLGNRDKPEDYQKLFDDTIKHTFIIDFDSAEWQGLNNDMIQYNNAYGTYKSNNYRKVDVTYSADDEQFVIPDVGIRTKGNIYSRYPPDDGAGNVRPVHYVLKFNETFDTVEGTQEYDWLKKREVFDLENLIFKWNRNYDPTYASELYSYRFFKEIGVVVPEASLAKFIIRIDGNVEMEELYLVQESMDEEFIRKHFQTIPTDEVGDLYKVVYGGSLEPVQSWQVGVRDWEVNYRPIYGKETNADIIDYTNLINFSVQLNSLSGNQLKTFLEQNMDLDSWIKSMAASVLLGNPDDYRGNTNNYYLYFDEMNKMSYIPFDFDHSLGQGWDGAPAFINYTIGNDIYEWGFPDWNPAEVPLVDQVLQFEEYQIMYEDYIEEFVTNGYFTYNHFSLLFDTLQSVYGDEFDMSNNKLYYFSAKRDAVLDDIDYYRNQRTN